MTTESPSLRSRMADWLWKSLESRSQPLQLRQPAKPLKPRRLEDRRVLSVTVSPFTPGTLNDITVDISGDGATGTFTVVGGDLLIDDLSDVDPAVSISLADIQSLTINGDAGQQIAEFVGSNAFTFGALALTNTVETAFIDQGITTTTGDLSIHVAEGLSATGGLANPAADLMSATGNISLIVDAGGITTGQLDAHGDILLEGEALSLEGALIATTGQISLTGTDVTIDGSLSAHTLLDISADDLTVNAGLTVSNGDLIISSTGDIFFSDDGDVTLLEGSFTINAGADADSDLTMSSGTLFTVTTGASNVVPAQLSAGGQIDLGEISITGVLTSLEITAGGGIADANGGGTNITAGEISLSAQQVGSLSDSLETAVAGLTLTVAGDAYVSQEGNLNLAFVSTSGTVAVSANGMLTVAASSAAAIQLNSNAGIALEGAVSATGPITIESFGANSDLTVQSTGSLSSSGGGISLVAGRVLTLDGNVSTGGAGSIGLQSDALSVGATSTIDAGANTISVRALTPGTALDLGGADSTGVLGLSGAELAQFTAGTLLIGDATSGSITISDALAFTTVTTLQLTTGASIVDDNATGVDLSVQNLALSAQTGIGAADALETAVSQLAFRNAASGNVQIQNSGALTVIGVGTLDGTNGFEVGNFGTGTTTLAASSPLTFAIDTTTVGSATYTAGETSDAPTFADRLTVNSGITVSVTGVASVLTLQAGDDIALNTGSTVSAASGSLVLTAGFGDQDASGAIDLSGTVTAANVLTLSSVTGVTDSVSGQINTDELEVLGSGNVVLGASHSFATLAANLAGSLTVTEADGFSIGTAGSTTGVTLAGTGTTLSLATTTGAIGIAADLTTDGDQTYGSAVNLLADATITAGQGNLTFVETLNGAFSLTISSANDVAFQAAVGTTTALTAFEVTAAGDLTFAEAVEVDGLITLVADAVDLQSTFDTTGAMTITNGDLLTIAGAVNSGGAFLQNGPGSVRLAANVTADTNLTFQSATVLATDITLTTTNGDISLQGTVNADGLVVGDEGLTLSANNGNIVLAGALGATTALDFVTATAGSGLETAAITTINTINLTATNTLTTNGDLESQGAEIVLTGNVIELGGDLLAQTDVTVDGPALLTTDVSVVATNGDIEFTSTIDAESLTLQAGGNIDLAGAIGGTTALDFLTATAGSDVATAAITTVDAINLTATGTLTTNGDLESQGAEIVLTGSLIELGGDLLALTDVTVDGAALLTTGVSVTATNGEIDFTSTIDAESLTLQAGGNIDLAGAIGGTTALDFLSATAGGDFQSAALTTVNAISVTATNTLTTAGPLQSQSGEIILTGNAIELGGDLLAQTNVTVDGATLLTTDVSVIATVGDIDFTSTINAESLTLQAGDNISLGGVIGGTTALDFLTATAGGDLETAAITTVNAITLTATNTLTTSGTLQAQSAGIVLTGGLVELGGDLLAQTDVTVDGAALLTTAISVTATNGDIEFTSTIDAESLTLLAGGNIAVTGAIGGTTALDVLTATAGDGLQMAAVTAADAITLTATNTLTTTGTLESQNDEIVLTGGLVELGGDLFAQTDVTVDGATLLTTDVSLIATDGDIGFTSTIDAESLILQAGNNINLAGAVGSTTALDLLTATAGGDLQTAAITTVNAITLTATNTLTTTGTLESQNAALVLTGSLIELGGDLLAQTNVTVDGAAFLTTGVSVTATNGEIDFTSTIDAESLTLQAGGNISLSGAIGGTTALDFLTATAGGDLATDAITTVNAINLTATGTLTSTGTLESQNAEIILTGSTIELGGDLLAQTNVTVDGAALLTTDVSAVATNGEIDFKSTIDAESLTLQAGNNINLGGAVGSVTALDVLTATAGGGLVTTAITTANAITLTATNTLTTSGTLESQNDEIVLTGSLIELGGDLLAQTNVTVDGAAFLTTGVSVTATNGEIDFTSTIDAESLTLQAGGNIDLAGAIGGTTALDFLTATAGGDLATAAITTVNAINLAATSTLTTNGDLESQSTEIVLTGSLIEVGGDLFAQTNVTVDGAALLTTDVLVVATNGDIEFSSTIDAESLTLQAGGNISLSGAIGGTTALDFLTATAGGNLQTVAVTAVNAITLTATNTLTTTGTLESQNAEIVLMGNLIELGADLLAQTNVTVDGAALLTSDVSLIATSGTISFTSTIDAESLTLQAGGNISFAGAVGSSVALDTLTITNAADVTFASTLRTTGIVEQLAGSGTTTFHGTSGSGIGGQLLITTNSLEFETADVVTVGNVVLKAQNNIGFNGAAGLNAGASTISISANQDNTGTGAFFQAGTNIVQTTNQTANALRIVVGGTGSALIGTLRAGTTSGVISVTAGGEIRDELTGEAANLTAFAAALRAGAGIGVSGGPTADLNTDLAQLAFSSTSDSVNVTNTRDLTVTVVDGLASSLAFGGGTIVADGSLTVAANLQVGGTFSLIAGNDNAAINDLILSADITHLMGEGEFFFRAGDNIQQTTGTITLTNNTSDLGRINFVADLEADGTDGMRGGITQTGGAVIAKELGLQAFNAITMNQAGNDAHILAATVAGSGQSFSFQDGDDLTIATIPGSAAVSGISTNAGDVTIQTGGLLTLGETGEDLLASGATVVLNSSGGFNAGTGAIIQASNLLLQGTGNFTSTQNNDLDTFAADIDGNLTFHDADDLVVDTVNGVQGISTGNPSNGGNILLTVVDDLTVQRTVSTLGGTGGIANLSGGTYNAAVIVGAGNISITSGGLDLIVNNNESSATTLTYQARRDVIFNAVVTTTDPSANIIIIADLDNDQVGGVRVNAAGGVISANDIIVSGSDLFATAGEVDAIRIEADGTNDQLLAAGNIVLQQRVTAQPASADIVIDGHIHSTGGDITIQPANVIRAQSVIQADSSTGTITFGRPTILTGDLEVMAGGNVVFSTINDDGQVGTSSQLTVTAAGTTTLNGAIGGIAAIDSVTTNGGGTTLLPVSVTTRFDQTYDDDIVLRQDTTLTATTSGDLTFNNTLNADTTVFGGESLTINTAGQAVFNGAVGNSSPLESLDVTAGSVDVNGAILVEGTLELEATSTINLDASVRSNNGPIRITAGGDIVQTVTGSNSLRTTQEDIVLTSTGGSISLTGQVYTFGGQLLSISALGDITSSDTTLNSLESQGQILVTSTQGVIALQGGIVASDGITLTALGTSGAITIAEGFVSGDFGFVNIQATGDLSFGSGTQAGYSGGAIWMESLAGGIFLNGDLIGDTELVRLTAETFLTATGDITVTNDGLEVSVANGDATIAGTITTGTSTTITANEIEVTGSVDAGTFVDLEAVTGAITINGGLNATLQTINVVADQAIQLDGAVTAGQAITFRSNNASVTTNNLITAQTGDVLVDAETTLTSNGTIQAITGNVSLVSQTADVILNGGILTNAGTIVVTAADSVSLTAAGDLTSQTGNITLTATAGAITQADGSEVNAGSGQIVLTATGDITLGLLQTTNATASAIRVESTAGAILDGDLDEGLDIVANSAGALVTLRAATGIGSSNALETQIDRLDAINGANAVRIVETDGLTVRQIVQQTMADVALDVGGALTVGEIGGPAIAMTSAQGDVTLTSGGEMTFQQAVAAGAGTIRLVSAGDITQQTSGVLTAATFGVRAVGDVVLGAANDVETFAADVNGSLRFADVDGFTIGSVTAKDGLLADIVGVQVGGDFTLCVGSGLNITQAVIVDGTFRIAAQGSVTQSAAGTITAGALGLQTTSGDLLLTADNDVGTLAAVNTSAAGQILFHDVDGYVVGVVTASDCFLGATGVVSNNGVVLLTNAAGTLDVTQNISSGTATLSLVADPGANLLVRAGVQITNSTQPLLVSAGQDVQLEDGVVIASQGGNLTLSAGRDLLTGDNVQLSTNGSGTLTLTSGGLVSGGTLTLGDRNSLTATTGTIVVQSSGALTAGDDLAITTTGPLATIELTAGGALSIGESALLQTSGPDITVDAAAGLALGAGSQLFSNGGVIELAAGAGMLSLGATSQVLTAGGDLTLTAGQTISLGAGALWSTSGGDLTVTSQLGAITLADTSFVNAGTGLVRFMAAGNITVGDIRSTNAGGSAVILNTTGGSILDADGGSGIDIIAPTISLQAATGIGAGNALELSTTLLSAVSDTGAIRLANNNGGNPLTIGTTGGFAGIMTAGEIQLTQQGTLIVDAGVISLPASGSIRLTANGPAADLILNQPVWALGSGQSGGIQLVAGRDLILNDTGATNDILLERNGQITGTAGDEVLIGPNVIVRSSTGSVTQVIPHLDNVVTPQVSALGRATISGELGRTDDDNLQVRVNWDEFDPTVQDNYVEPGDPRNIEQDPTSPVDFTYDHFYFGNPDIANPSAPISITITVSHDPNIVFNQGAPVVLPPGFTGDLNTISYTSIAPVPGEGFGSFPFEISVMEPTLAFPTPTPFDASLLQVSTIVEQGLNDVIYNTASDSSSGGERVLKLLVLNVEGEIVEEVLLPVSVLDDFDDLTRQLPDGTYRLLLVEPGEQEGRLVYEFAIHEGRVASGSREDNGDRPPSMQSAPPTPETLLPPDPFPPADATDPENAPAAEAQLETSVRDQLPSRQAWRVRQAVGRYALIESLPPSLAKLEAASSEDDTPLAGEETLATDNLAISGWGTAAVLAVAIPPRAIWSRSAHALRRWQSFANAEHRLPDNHLEPLTCGESPSCERGVPC